MALDLGASVAIFLALAIVLMALFCLVTKYFNYRLRKALEDANEVYSMIDDICRDSEEEIEGEYDEFLKKRKEERLKSNKRPAKEEDNLIEMTEVKEPLNGSSDIYGLSILRRRLNGEVIPIKQEAATNRSAASLKSFRPEKISTTNRNDLTNKDQLQKIHITSHTFVNKMVAYTESGLQIIEFKVNSIRKESQTNITENKTHRRYTIPEKDNGFEDQLEILGFEKDEFGCYKYETTVQIQNMKTQESYQISNLKTNESKSQLQFPDFYKLVDELINGGI